MVQMMLVFGWVGGWEPGVCMSCKKRDNLYVDPPFANRAVSLYIVCIRKRISKCTRTSDYEIQPTWELVCPF